MRRSIATRRCTQSRVEPLGSIAVRADGVRCAAQALSEKINALQDYVMANCSLADPLSQRVLKLVRFRRMPPVWDHRVGVGLS